MNGWKMPAARRGVCRLIDSLSAEDRFEVIAFDNSIDTVSDRILSHKKRRESRWISATDANRFEATRWLSQINARGGTEMRSALLRAMDTFRNDDVESIPTGDEASNRSRAIVLITDGQITGEDSVLQALSTLIDESRPRLYALGIDRAVNGGVLKRLTKFSGGSFDLVESEQRLDEVMHRFADEIGSPAIHNFAIEPVERQTNDLTLAPENLRTLYSGHVYSIFGRVNMEEDIALKLNGLNADGSAWSEQITVTSDEFDQNSGSTYLAMWGRQRVRELEDRYVTSDAGRELQKQIIQSSLESNVLSRYTAYVAVDDSEVVTDGKSPHRIVQPLDLPEGWSLNPIPKEHLISLRPKTSVSPMTFPLRSWIDPHDFQQRVLRTKIVSAQQYAEAEKRTADRDFGVGVSLIELGYLTSDQFAKIVAESHSLPYVDAHIQVAKDVVELIPESVARENFVCPYSSSATSLSVLISDPTDFETLDKLQFILNRNIQPVIATPERIAAAIDDHYGDAGESVDSMLQEFTETAIDFTECDLSDDLAFGISPPASADLFDATSVSADSSRFARRHGALRVKKSVSPRHEPDEDPVVKLVNLILSEAIMMKATHILIRPLNDRLRIEYVIDGKDVERDQPPLRLLDAITTRLKILAQVDMADFDEFQTGEFTFKQHGKSFEFVIHFATTSKGPEILIEVKASYAVLSDSVIEWKKTHAPDLLKDGQPDP